ncbi:membrane protein [Sphingomonas sp. DBB INV C78]
MGWLLIGLVAGVLGKLIMPGRDPGGFVVTILLGIAGALLAGYVATILNIGVEGWIRQYGAAILGSVALLAIYRIIMRVRGR